MHAHTKQNLAMADELVLSQEEETNSSFNTPSSTVCCRMDHTMLRRSWLEATTTEGVTDTGPINYATLSSSKQSLSERCCLYLVR